MNNALLIEKNKYLLMVIVCTYNHECYIEDCLKGIVMQKTTFPFVAVVLDDCSTDGTKEIIQQYESLYPEIIKGIYFTENQYSQGKNTMSLLKTHIYKFKYVALCEGDDYWTDPLKLQKQVLFMDKHPECTLCFHNAVEHWEDGRYPDALFSRIESREYLGVEIYDKYKIATASCVINVKVFEHDDFGWIINNKDFLFLDVVLFLYCGMYGKLYGIEDTMSVYRRNPMSVTLKVESNAILHLKKLVQCCLHYRAIKVHFGGYYGANFINAGNKILFKWILKGMIYSLKMKNIRAYFYFFKLGFSESIIMTVKTQIKLLYLIFKYIINH